MSAAAAANHCRIVWAYSRPLLKSGWLAPAKYLSEAGKAAHWKFPDFDRTMDGRIIRRRSSDLADDSPANVALRPC